MHLERENFEEKKPTGIWGIKLGGVLYLSEVYIKILSFIH